MTYQVPVIAEVEECVEPVRKDNIFPTVAIVNGQSLKLDESLVLGPDPMMVEHDILKGAKLTTYRTQGNMNFLQCVNMTCTDLIVNYDGHVSEIEHSGNVLNVVPQIEDLLVLFQSNLVFKQGFNRDCVTEFYVPVFQPFGGELTDFVNASYVERSKTRIIGNSSVSYVKWAEINFGDPLFIFSCRSLEEWYTYVYTGYCKMYWSF
jgi:hypothetical protein